MTENYEVAKLLVTAHIAALTSDELKHIIPSTVDITNRKQVDASLRQHLLSYYLTSKHSAYFKALTHKELSQLLKLPIKAIPQHYLD